MRQIRKILEYHFDRKLSADQTAAALGVAKGTVINAWHRFERSSLGWPLTAETTDSELESTLYPVQEAPESPGSDPVRPDIDWLERELRRPHMTLQRLWEEYHESHPDGLSRSAFYRYWNARRPPKVTLKMIHKGGDKLFVDYSGDGPSYVDRTTGEIIDAHLFVASWGASNYTYAEATASEGTEDFVTSHPRAFEYFGVAPHGLVPDNLKSGVTTPSRYDPVINPLYEAMASHYGCTVLPARICKPQDKAPVENAVLQTQRFILARLRNRQFFSLSEVNAAIREELELLNDRPMRDYGGQTRRQRFELLDKPYARALPAESFKMTKLKTGIRVAPNYHIRFEDHYYSVPCLLVGKVVDVHQIGNIIELYHDGVHLVRHRKGPRNYGYTTTDGHMPANHRYVRGGWSEDYFLSQADAIGTNCRAAMEQVMKRKTHVQQAFNAARGMLQLAKVYSNPRMENACRRALQFNSASYQSIKSILEKGLDKQIELPFHDEKSVEAAPHENLRGAHYYAG